MYDQCSSQLKAHCTTSVSPFVANLLMEEYENKAISMATNPPRIWKKGVLMTHFSYKGEKTGLNFYISNSVDPHM